MKRLKFSPNLVLKVLSGEKTSTWRIDDEKNITKGDELILVNASNGEEFAQAKVTEVYEKTFGELEEADKSGHERYESDREMYEVYSSYYKKQVDSKQRIKIIRFELQ